MKNKAFTLVEILIVVGLFGLLSGIILQTYTTISRISYRIQQEKEIAKEALVLTQVLENLAQTTTIDYSKHPYGDLQASEGMVSELHLKDEKNQGISIKTDGTCFQASELREQKQKENGPSSELELLPVENEEILKTIRNSNCKLILGKNGETITLLDSKKFNISQAQFKIIPFISNQDLQNIYASESQNTDIKELPPAGKPGFWLFITLTSKHYTPSQRSNNVVLPLQTFVSLQGATPSIYSPVKNEKPTD
ncbi:MAG: type II secretion system protein [candidate division SR1 bacterium]|nr:type II secretion system protein [candidate division SR1 bacterium]